MSMTKLKAILLIVAFSLTVVILIPATLLGAIVEGVICGTGREVLNWYRVWKSELPDDIDNIKREYARAKR